MDEFAQADYDDHLLELAEERMIREEDWCELHGDGREWPSLEQACQDMGWDRAQAAREIPNAR